MSPSSTSYLRIWWLKTAVSCNLSLKQNMELWSNALTSLFSLSTSSTPRCATQYARTEAFASPVFANAERCTRGYTVRQDVSKILCQFNFVFLNSRRIWLLLILDVRVHDWTRHRRNSHFVAERQVQR